MDRDPFGHRKYHGLYFVLGFLIAFVAFMMLSGCDQPNTTGGIYEEPPVMCCQALTPSCMACADSCTVDEWIEKTCGSNAIGVEYAGWDEASNEPLWLCQAEIIN